MGERIVRDLVAAGILRVEDGNHGNDRPRPDEFDDDGVAFIRAADMTSGVVDFEGAGKINDVARSRIRKGVGAPGDVILSHKGTVGRVAVAPLDAPDYVCSPQTTFWRSLDHSVLDQIYLRYVLLSEPFQRQLSTLGGQTDMAPYVSLTDQRGMSIPVPPVEDQRSIAEVLGALDDKIAANDRIITTLLELANATFRQAAAGLQPSERKFIQLASVGGGGTPKTSIEEYWEGDIAWATPTDVTGLAAPYLRTTSRTITDAGLAACSSALYPAGSILMTSRATIGAFAIAQCPTAVNQGFIVVNANDPAYQWWLFHEMQDRVPEFLSHANGATFLELPRGKFKELAVRLPSEDVIVAFNDTVAPLHAAAAQLSLESERLAATRDELLPLLMSGKLRVRGIAQPESPRGGDDGADSSH